MITMYPKGTYHFNWQEFKSGSMLHVEFSTFCYIKLQNLETAPNKKVILCEIKRHTIHHVASAWGGVPTLDRWGVPTLWYPSPVLMWPGGRGYLPWMGVPTLDWGTYLGLGYLPWGTPSPSWCGQGKGVPTLDGGNYLGVPLPQPGHDGGRGTHLSQITSPPPMWTDRHLWKQYLPVILRMQVVITWSIVSPK